MKKIFGISLVLCIALMLAACERADYPVSPPQAPPVEETDIDTPPREYDLEPEVTPSGETEIPTREELPFNISMTFLASDEFLSAFDYLHEVDYSYARGRGAIDTDLRLVIWADAPLREIALLQLGGGDISCIGCDGCNEALPWGRMIRVPRDTFGLVEELPIGEAFVINNYIPGGTWAASGITLVDENDVRRYFVIISDQMGFSEEWFVLHRFENFADTMPPDCWQPW